MTRQARISRSVLSDQVKDRLLQAILDGRYPPGARIVETRVARELGTSQAPVREALRDLEGLGVVETTAFRGARVRRPSADELLEAFAVRAELESLAARLAVAKIEEGDLEALAGLVATMQEAAESGETYAEATADAAFHGRVVELAGNATLTRVWRTLEPFLRTYITIVSPGADRRRIADEHLPILDALRRRDPDLAVEVLHTHFERAAAGLASHWAERGDTAAAAGSDEAGAGAPASLPQLARQPA
ncbi:MAG: GntR family transcriptional regulator [Chloroflexota bacterium]